MKLTDIPVDRPIATLMLLLSLTVLGVVAIFRLPLDSFPIVEEPEVHVTVPFPGSHPLEALKDIVKPIEEEVATIPDIRSIRSDAASGEANVRIEFDWSSNLDLKKMEVREAVERARTRLPEGIGSIRIEGDTDGPGGGSILEGRISAERNLSESWDLLDRRIRRPLERVRGVARVDLGGVERRQVRIDIDPEALKRHRIDAGEVLTALQGANLDVDLGAIHGDLLRYDARSVGRFASLEEIRDLRISSSGARIRDVATVLTQEPDLEYGRHLDREFAISIEVFKEPTANTVDTVDGLLEEIGRIERDPELAGIKLLVWHNAGEDILRSLAGLRNAGLFGGLLAVFVLYFFLRRVSSTLIVAAAIPFSLVVTGGAMYMLGRGLNVLSMLGLMLGVGMLVDNAVVVMENIYRKQGQGIEPFEAARTGAREVALAVVASTATTVIVWSWLFVSDRSTLTILVGEIAVTICLAVGCSLLISLTFIPLAAARFVPHREVRPGFVLRRIVPAYRGILAWTLRHRLASLGGLLLLAASAGIPISRIEQTGEPSMKERAVPIRYQALDPIDKEAMERVVDRVEDWLEAHQSEFGYESIYSYFQNSGYAVTQVYLPWERTGREDLDRLRTQMRGSLPTIAGIRLEVGDRMWGGRRSEGGRTIPVALHGEDPEYLRDLATEVEQRLRGMDGVREVYGPTLQGQQEVRVLVDAERARALGVSPQAVSDAVAFTYRGRHLRRYQEGANELETVLSLPDDLRPGVASLDDLLVPVPSGGSVPLGSVAGIAVARTDQRIEREDRQTTTWVSAQFGDEVTTEQGQARIGERLRGLSLPEGYSWDWGQWGHDRDDSLATMGRGVGLALLVVVLLMAALFESFTQPLAIVVTLPLAFFGGFWSLWLLGYELDPVAFIGLIILIGIVVNNGIVMVDHVNTLRRGGRERVEALLEGCGDRLRPVLMTAITTLFGLLPLAISKPTVAGAYIDSLAVVVIGGLATSTLFTLLALPVWYSTLEDLGSILFRSLPRFSRVATPRSPAGPVRAPGRAD